jgi:hypothetical protein
MSNTETGLYLYDGTIGNVGMPGAPVVDFRLAVNAVSGDVTGQVEIHQAIQGGNYSGNVTGVMHYTGYGEYTKVISLQGYVHAAPPLIGTFPFRAHMSINNEGNGMGGFDYLDVHVNGVPVTAK